MNHLCNFGYMLIRCGFLHLILFSGTVLATTSGSTGPVFGRQITINDPVVLNGSLVFSSSVPAVTDPDGESVDHWLYQWKVNGVVGAEFSTTKADFSEISYKARAVDFNGKLQLCVKAVSPTGCYPDETCRSERVCSAEVDISEPVVHGVFVGDDLDTVNNVLADGVSNNVVRIEVRSADGRYNAPGYPVTLTASNGAIIQNSITTNSIGFAYPSIKSNTSGESVITATTGYGLSKQVRVNFEADYELRVSGIRIPSFTNDVHGWIYNGQHIGGVEVTISLTKGGNAVQGAFFSVPCEIDGDYFKTPCGNLATDVNGVIKYRAFDIWDGADNDVYTHTYQAPTGRTYTATYAVP